MSISKKRKEKRKAEEGAQKPPKQSPAVEGPVDTPGIPKITRPVSDLQLPSRADPAHSIHGTNARAPGAKKDENLQEAHDYVTAIDGAYETYLKGEVDIGELDVMSRIENARKHAEKIEDPDEKARMFIKLATSVGRFSGPMKSDELKDMALNLCDEAEKTGYILEFECSEVKKEIYVMREKELPKPAEPEQKPEPEEKPEDAQKPEPEDEEGRVAVPILAEDSVDIKFDEPTPEDKVDEPAEVTGDSVLVPPMSDEERDSIIRNAPDQKFANEVSAAIAKSKYDDALQKALKIKDKELRNEKIENVADEYAKKGDYKKARSIADNIEDPLFRARVVKEFATEFQMNSKDPKVILKAGTTLKDALRVAESAPPNKARAEVVKDIEEAMNEFEEMKRTNRKVRDLVKRKKRTKWIAIVGSIALAFLTEAYAKDVKDWVGERINGKAKTGQVEEAKAEPVDLSGKVDRLEFDHLGERVGLLEPMGKSTGLYDGMANLSGENREELDYSKLKDGKVRKFEDVDKDIAEAVKETELKEKLDEIASIDFEGEDELTDLDKVTRQLELVNAKIEEIAEYDQTSDQLEALKAVLEEKEQLLTLAKIVAAYKAGYSDDFCGTIQIDIQDISCEEDQWIVLTDKNGVPMRIPVYDEPVDCPDDCPKRKGGKKAPEPERGKGEFKPSG